MTARTIIKQGKGIRFERAAAGAILPGHLVSLNSDDALVVHATAQGKTPPIFAIENELFGRDLTVAYASADRVLAEWCTPGMQINALFGIASHTIAIGDFLESAGDGTLKKVAGLTGSLTGTPDGTLSDITFNSTWSSGQANEINVNFEEFQLLLNRQRPGAIAMALEAVGTLAAAAHYRVAIL